MRCYRITGPSMTSQWGSRISTSLFLLRWLQFGDEMSMWALHAQCRQDDMWGCHQLDVRRGQDGLTRSALIASFLVTHCGERR